MTESWPAAYFGPHATVVTVNRRLARTLRDNYDHHQARAGLVVWPSPDILPYGAFLERCWLDLADAQGADASLLLSQTQALVLWERVIEESVRVRGDHGLIQIGAAARKAQQAWELRHEWRLDVNHYAGYLSAEVLAYRAWEHQFQRRCAASRWTDRATLGASLAEAVVGYAIPVPGCLVLAGFDRLSPLQSELFDAFRDTGVVVHRLPGCDRAERAVRTAFATETEELHAVGSWARWLLEADATKRIGIVIPDLARRRRDVEYVLEDLLTPQASLQGSATAARPFNLSLGAPLAAVPLVRHVLLFLDLLGPGLSLAGAGEMLRSPFVTGAERERSERGRLDAALRDIGEAEVTLESLRFHANRDAQITPELAGVLNQVSELRDSAPSHGSPAVWGQLFSDVLRAMGWPGEASLGDVEYQTVGALREQLAAFAALGAVLGRISIDQARLRLRQLCGQRVFQPQSPPAPVQVLGMLEAAGQSFDHLWMAGMHDRAWPASQYANPFIPVALQRAAGIPQASPRDALGFAKRQFERLLASAGDVIVSHAGTDQDVVLHASPLVDGINYVDVGALPFGQAVPYRELLLASAPVLETFPDDLAPALSGNALIRGGAGMFRDQSACPFRAFARHRLQAEAVDAAPAPVDARVRGTLAHRVLELVWRALGGHAALLRLPPEAREQLVAGSVEQALREAARERGKTLSGRFLVLETERLRQLVNNWLDLEYRREPFEVLAPEQGATASFAGLTFHLRPDRIDRVGDALLLLDYKTAEVTAASWFDDRPDEPQLPLYAIVMSDQAPESIVDALAFAIVKRGAMKLHGLAAQPGFDQGITALENTRLPAAKAFPGWTELLAHWREALATLASGFRYGDARVAPKRGATTCKTCNLAALCRIGEHLSVPEPRDQVC